MPSVTLATEDTAVRVEARADRVLLSSLKSPRGSWDWIAGNGQAGRVNVMPIPFIATAQVNGQAVPLAWKFAGSRQSKSGPRRAVFRFVCSNPALELQSIWQARSGPGPIEHSLRILNRSRAPVLLPLQTSLVFAIRPPAAHALEHWWVEKGANTPTPFGTHRHRVTADYAAALLSLPYARDEARERDPIPWTSVQDVEGRQGWYAGIAFSGRVRLSLNALPASKGAGTGLRADLGLDPNESAGQRYRTRLAPGETFEAPTVFLGCYTGDVDDGANRLRRWVETYLRPPVRDPRYPLLVNNSWGSGMAVDETLARRMIEETAELGLELFHIDAGWFRGVGDWHPHPAKFPDGLAPIADYAHSKGLKFGLWVGWTQGGIATDPTGRLANLSVFDPQMKDWFTRDYPPDWQPSDFTGADVCLADPRAADWCLHDLRRIVRDYKLDLLEHDQRMIVENCDRQDHRHTDAPTDIAYRAARGYYQVYDTLRQENPRLLFENCVNGGHTVDYGIVQRTHYISITDTYDPLSNRRAFYDASYALPPAMCECYVENWPARTLANFLYMLRSGMMGWCTIMTDTSQWNEAQHAAAKKQFALYKAWLRPLIQSANLYHVSERPDGVRWDGMQYYDPKTGKGVLFAFRGTTDAERHTFRLKGLEPNARYKLVFTDGTSEPTARSGRDLMRHGIPVRLTEPQSSEIVTLTREK